MTASTYALFQKLQCELLEFTDRIEPIETVAGNELFQRLSDLMFEDLIESDRARASIEANF